MKTTFDKEELKRIILPRLEPIRREDCFFSYDSEEDCYAELQKAVHADKCLYGATKIVFFYDDLPDWVVKVPIYGEKNWDYDLDDWFCDSYSGAWDVIENEWATDLSNYCEVESYIAECSRGEDLDYFFAQTYYLGDVGDVEVYISERCEEEEDENTISPSQPSRSTAQEMIKSSTYIQDRCYEVRLHVDTLSKIVECYGALAARQLIDFIERYHITDLHMGNFALSKEGKIQIIDYSGFNN